MRMYFEQLKRNARYTKIDSWKIKSHLSFESLGGILGETNEDKNLEPSVIVTTKAV